EGILHVFMPPCTHLEHYLDLVAAIELTAENLAIPVRLEGYTPPKDSRIDQFQITPDPGVIEVNIHPARSWQELENNTHILYEEARLVRLGTEKFMLDGRHGGTGGGNHVTLGGPTPSDSPLLRRPDLLRSLVSYWQNHPGLSYLFSGLFIGPTSQAPRVDEGRDDRLYEMEIAFSQVPPGEVAQPWLVDRLMRNLLTDITGNTHRSEFCIDKLYSPDSSSGRQGLLEFRGFEMPPHPQMSLVQMLLLRTLVARFWKEPFTRPLIRWGTELHDRFMLPHFVQSDVADVVKDLQSSGYDFKLDWLDPFLEFRFPHYGTINIGDIQIDLHWAIEPWHVLGEEITNIGTARFVDSSVERLQVRVRGLSGSRYTVSCNRLPLPLRNTGVKGEYVAGVRYRAWNPPSGLHPTIGVHTPLVFDLVDTWNGRSIGGCTYYVSHPGGLSYDVYPVNAVEAESRRVSRFWDYGHTQGAMDFLPATTGQFKRTLEAGGSPEGTRFSLEQNISPEFPYTLDLRRFSAP
ncbi:MAG: transglutaminase family protein, partial [Gammaproteobacteria bacterium]|nr:transglutaminase family protein [Gammaproteobacteria bacterium]